jgi:acetoacetyl-CoA synthetase
MSVCWTPSQTQITSSNLFHFQTWLEKKHHTKFANYHELWQWSTDHVEHFWESILQFFQIEYTGSYQKVFSSDKSMYRCRWFEGIELSYAAHVFRNKTSKHPAIIYKNETNETQQLSWPDLEEQVSRVQQFLLNKGVKMGDRVAGYLANTPESVVAFLACNSIGAIWSCCSPDFGTESVIDRFQQIKPNVFIASQGYHYNGKYFDKTAEIENICQSITSIKTTLIIGDIPNNSYHGWEKIIKTQTNKSLIFKNVPFQHPIWILYSSGTTGKPKAIVHRSGGMILEHYKALALHQDCKPDERYLWYSTTGWMMWNYALSSLLCGCTLCIYDGSPNYPKTTAIWDFVNRQEINHFGIGAAYYLNCKKKAIEIDKTYPLPKLRTLGSTGSPLPADAFAYIYQHIKKDVWLISLSGGTDVCSAFVGGSPFLPVVKGEIQCRMLGAAIEAWDDHGTSVMDQLGELMISKAMPCMPVYFWDDPDFEKYKHAYFEQNERIWQHGDWIKITKNEGVIIYGRSDATLNRDGIRIGTAEIYQAIDQIPEVKDSLVVCLEKQDGSSFMPLFVVLDEQFELDDAIKARINKQIKQQYSPRHVPNEIFAVKDIPYTISGKKMEMPIKKIILGMPVAKSVTLGAMRNPESISDFIQLAKQIGIS